MDDEKNMVREIAEMNAIKDANERLDSWPLIVLPGHAKLESLESAKEAPTRRKGVHKFQRLGDWRHYVIAQTIKGTTAWYKFDPFSITAVLNDHEPATQNSNPGWRDHNAVFEPKWTKNYARWVSMCGNPLSQTQLATFLEDNAEDVTMPPGVDLFEMIKNLEATVNVKFRSDVNLDNGNRRIEYQAQTGTKSGEIEIPTRLTLEVAIFDGEEPIPVQVSLRHKLDGEKLVFGLEIRRRDQTEQAAKEALITRAREIPDTIAIYQVPN